MMYWDYKEDKWKRPISRYRENISDNSYFIWSKEEIKPYRQCVNEGAQYPGKACHLVEIVCTTDKVEKLKAIWKPTYTLYNRAQNIWYLRNGYMTPYDLKGYMTIDQFNKHFPGWRI